VAAILQSYNGEPLYSSDVHAREALISVRGEDQNPRRLDMSEKMISRRDAFSLLGLAAVLGFALPAEVLTASDAEAQAQTTAPATTPAPSGGTVGMQRRHARRTGRHERRHARRAGRHERRETRRGGGEATEKK
jgi:acyl CoA:acetate/3-ketoacid CoA transferase